MEIPAANLQERQAYKLLTGSIVPRPIAWVTTSDRAGRVNAAPFSFFTGISTVPPLVGFSLNRRQPGKPKDTQRNIEETGEFVINVVPEELAQAMHRTATDYPPGVDELQQAGLATTPAAMVGPPRIADSPIHLECVLERTVPFGEHTFIVGRIVLFNFRDDVYDSQRHSVRIEALRPLARLSGGAYARLGEHFEVKWQRS